MSDSIVARAANGCEDELSLLRAANQQLTLSALESQRKESMATAACRQQAGLPGDGCP
jgi:hypothetical protein